MNNSQLQNYLNQWCENAPVGRWGWATLETPLSIDFYKNWIDQGYHSSMNYLKDHLPAKTDPKILGTKLQSALVFAFPYFPKKSENNFPLQHLRTALYAQDEDYHIWIKRHLSGLTESLKEIFPQEEFLIFTDSSPILERDLAYRSGLGWVGKNTCLIDQKTGSLFLIGEIYTSLNISGEIKIQPDLCGKCQACIEVCPTKALKSPKLLDANLCISYLTIESRQLPPENLRSAIGDWFFGCDLCQTVCPWNQKPFKNEMKLKSQILQNIESRSDLIDELRMILTSSGKKLEKIFARTPLLRAGPFGLKRNALLVAGNLNIYELKPEINELLKNEKLAELADWSLKKLTEKDLQKRL